ncbi:MAG TPA: single-stranded-DNA-specific exonuclease RecJ [Acidobacteriaceae bacterium]|jgi:single-stranded-DNA-specific exonuclease
MPQPPLDTDDASWVIRAQDSPAARTLAEELNLPASLARVLVCRGFATVEAAQAFLAPSLQALHDPFLMKGMYDAVDRLSYALHNAQPILIYGDYDVDGTVATVLLKTAAERVAASFGVAADVRYHIPHRIREGYGMQESRIESAAAEGVRLVISVDTGIRAFAAAREAERVGLDLIVTDHHLPDAAAGVPYALAVLNPNQPDCGYPCKELCGAGVAFKLAQALLESVATTEDERRRLREKTLPSFLKLLSIATIADSVPLVDENRVIASIGLRELQRPAQPGLRALIELAGVDTSRPITATDVGFRIGPRINAAGRMDIASDVVDMFLARDPAVAKALAEKLHSLNDDRRATESEALREIEARLEAMTALPEGLAACLVLDDPAWHRGVIGILASRVVDRTGRPALVIAHEDGHAYGSGRSVAGFHLLDALTAVDSASDSPDVRLFSRFGGHAHAVGFSLPSVRVSDLRERMIRHALAHGLQAAAGEIVECDAELRLSEITTDFLTSLEQMGPFGQGNPEPLFVSFGVVLTAPPKVIKDRHLRLGVEDPETGTRFGGMAWSRRTDWAVRAQTEGWSQGDRFDLAFRMHRNWHPDFGGWELEIVAIRRQRNSV